MIKISDLKKKKKKKDNFMDAAKMQNSNGLIIITFFCVFENDRCDYWLKILILWRKKISD